jgi:hypothetical protein
MLHFPRIVARLVLQTLLKVYGASLLKTLTLYYPPSQSSLRTRFRWIAIASSNAKVLHGQPPNRQRALLEITHPRILEDEAYCSRTHATEKRKRSLSTFEELGGDIVVKPIFGAAGKATRNIDKEIATQSTKPYIPPRLNLHARIRCPTNKRHRAFVKKTQVIASMRRMAQSGKPTIARS